MPPSIRTACATASLLAVAATANAEVLRVEYEAVFDAPTPPWPDGVVMAGTYSFDSKAAPIISGNVVNYPVLSHTFTLTKDAGTPSVFTSENLNIIISNDEPSDSGDLLKDEYRVDGPTGLFRWTADDFVTIFQVGVSFVTFANPNPSLADTHLPLEDADLSGFQLPDGNVTIKFGDATQDFITVGRLTSFQFVDGAQTVACEGFFEPFDVTIGLPRKSSRVIPLRMSLSDEGGVKLGPDELAAPIINMHYAGVFDGGDLDELVDSAGRATEGNAFVWDAATELWKYNLGTKPFSQPGTYRVDVTNGDDSYSINPACSGIFVRK